MFVNSVDIDDTVSPTNDPSAGTTIDTLSILKSVTDSSSSDTASTVQETEASTTTSKPSLSVYLVLYLTRLSLLLTIVVFLP